MKSSPALPFNIFFHKLPQIENTESEKLKFVTTVVHLIKNDIKTDVRKYLYSRPEEISPLVHNLGYIRESCHAA